MTLSVHCSTTVLHSPAIADDTNLLRLYLGRLHRDADFSFLLTGIIALLANPLNAALTYLPNSAKSITAVEEVVLLLWNILQVNVGFLRYVCTSEMTLELVRALLYQCALARVDHSMVWLCRVRDTVAEWIPTILFKHS